MKNDVKKFGNIDDRVRSCRAVFARVGNLSLVIGLFVATRVGLRFSGAGTISLKDIGNCEGDTNNITFLLEFLAVILSRHSAT